jgi:hypothetical protein
VGSLPKRARFYSTDLERLRIRVPLFRLAVACVDGL